MVADIHCVILVWNLFCCIMRSPEKFVTFILGKNTESLVCNMDYRGDSPEVERLLD